MIYNTSFNENLHSYVNNINTHEGELICLDSDEAWPTLKYADASGLLDKLRFKLETTLEGTDCHCFH